MGVSKQERPKKIQKITNLTIILWNPMLKNQSVDSLTKLGAPNIEDFVGNFFPY